MEKRNSVFIATSIDGYIADREGGIKWLDSIPNPDQNDMGYFAFMQRIDALVMGRKTYETVLGFGIPWPYTKPVFVYSSNLKNLPDELRERVWIVAGTPSEIVDQINRKGFRRLYIDGGQTIQSFLKADFIDEMIITKIPVVLGGGISLFGEMPGRIEFSLVKSEVYLNEVVQDTYRRKR